MANVAGWVRDHFVTQFTLRSSMPEDAEFIYGVSELTMRQHVEATGKRWATERMREKCGNDARDANTKIVLVDDRNAGVYAAFERDGAYWIDMLFLMPAVQKQGIGTALVASARTAAERRSLPIRIQVLSTNPAKEFWAARGFLVTSLEGLFYVMESAAPPDGG